MKKNARKPMAEMKTYLKYGFMCKECFKRSCKRLGLNVPALAELAESATVGLKEMEEK